MMHFSINDHVDILVEVLKRLDGRSLGVAACVCRLWSAVARNDALWEDLCFRHVVSPPPPSSLRPVILALGGYKRLYMVCLRPVLSRLGASSARRLWTRNELQLSLSLFCVDYYERLGRLGDPPAPSLRFLCKPLPDVKQLDCHRVAQQQKDFVPVIGSPSLCFLAKWCLCSTRLLYHFADIL